MASTYPRGVEKAVKDALNAEKVAGVVWSITSNTSIPKAGMGLVELLSDSEHSDIDKAMAVHIVAGAATRDAAWDAGHAVEDFFLNVVALGPIYLDDVSRDFGNRVELVDNSSPALFIADSQWLLTLRAADAPVTGQ